MTTRTSSKLSILSLFALFVGGYGQCGQNCGPVLTDAQSCIRECVNKDPIPEYGGAYDFSTNGASLLWQCMPDNGRTTVFSDDPLIDLMACCDMSAPCNATMMNARRCSQRDCIPSCLNTTSAAYSSCLTTKSQEGTCNFAGLCVGQLTGSDSFEFASTLTNAVSQVSATDCSPLDPFVDGICDIGFSCCEPCDIAPLTTCVVNEFLLPFSGTGVSCPISTPVNQSCEITVAQAVAVGRASELGGGMEEESLEEMGDFEGADMDDCERSLTFDFIVHNETYAADRFMTCLGKKIGQVLSEDELMNDKNSSAAGAGGKSSAATLAVGALSVILATFTAYTL